MKQTRILIIGAGGQLGAELAQGLWAVYGTDHVIAADIKNVNGVLQQGPFEIFDVLDRNKLTEILVKHRITQIYHLAAVLSATGEQDPQRAWKINMDSLILVLEAARALKIEKVYWPSSIAVFGKDTPKVDTPQSTIMSPSTVYGISKLAGELWCSYYFNRFGVDIRSLRYPGLIGYKTQPGGGTTDYAVEIFHKALQAKKYECYLSEHTTLPMMYMSDAVRATIELMEAPSENIRIRTGYNIGAISVSPDLLAKSIRKHIPEFEISYKPDFREAIAQNWPESIDDSAARKDWGWQHAFNVESMTADMLENLRLQQQH
jgi:nucleoside-diphosphate-sugar epimerase